MPRPQKGFNFNIEGKEIKRIKVSAKMFLLKFHPCTESFIKNICKGSCCRTQKGTIISIVPSEEPNIKRQGGVIKGGLLQSTNKNCPFQSKKNYCLLHNTSYKPFGCIVSPFNLNHNDTLIVRYRYTSLKCYRKDKENHIPVYEAHRSSLLYLFGEKQLGKIIGDIIKYQKDVFANISKEHYDMFKYNSNSKLKQRSKYET